MKKLLIASKNKHKIVEYQSMLSPLGYQVVSLFDYPDVPPIEETGTTFRDNARIKAETLSRITGCDVIADDSGLAVTALDGAPGVYSARFAGEHVTYADNNHHLLAEMDGIMDRSAYFITVICLYQRGQEPIYFEGRLHGTIATTHKGDHGFGYDPIFVLADGRHLAELPLEEKNQISHRANALRQLVAWLTSQSVDS